MYWEEGNVFSNKILKYLKILKMYVFDSWTFILKCQDLLFTITIVSVENNFGLLKMVAKNQFWHVNLEIA